jgi:DNA ligase-associated metallophosphoesterase
VKSFQWGELTLLPSRAVWFESARTLIVADVHLGKAASFRAAGLPVPVGTTRENLVRLDALIEAHRPRRLVALGDLFHSRAAYRGSSLEEFAAWRTRRAALAITLVAGNHDARAGAPPPELALETVSDPHTLEGIECRHHPLNDAEAGGPPVLAGHLHPAARLRGPGRDSLRLPCFVLRGRQLILPAFGEFTGGATAMADADTALWLVAEDRLVQIPGGDRGRAPAR